jgi:hypothetical protein
MARKKADTPEHRTSLAVWDLASPLVVDRPAKMKVGAKCSAGCLLADHEIEIHDRTGRAIASASLGATPWPGTSGLYWAELEFSAPVAAATHSWVVSCAHGDASSAFTFITVPPPDHTLTIRVRDKTTQAPLADVEIRLDVYRASSNEQGLAKLDLPKGTYALSVWKVGYEPFSKAVHVTDALAVDVEIAVEPEAAQPYWM